MPSSIMKKTLLGLFDKPLPFCGCGIGWFSFLLGFVFPVMLYFVTALCLCNYYQRHTRERSGLAASTIAAMIDTDDCSVHHTLLFHMGSNRPRLDCSVPTSKLTALGTRTDSPSDGQVHKSYKLQGGR